MARVTSSTFSFLSFSMIAGVLAACSGGNDQGQTHQDQVGGGSYVTPTGGKSGTGGSRATGGRASTGGTTTAGGKTSTGGAVNTAGAATVGGTTAAGGSSTEGGASTGTSVTGGTMATGGSSTEGGASAVGGTSTAGGSTGTGGSSTAGGATTAGGTTATGGSSTAGGATAEGGNTAAGGTTTAGGTSAAGGSSSPEACGLFTDTPPATFCTPSGTTIPVTNICTGSAGCQAGGMVIKGSSTGLNLTGTVYSVAPVFQGTPFTNAGCDSGGISASDPATGTAFTGMSVTITNSGTVPVVVNILLPDIASGSGSTSAYSATMKASVTVPVSTSSSTFNLHWVDFAPSCLLPTGVNFDPKKILALGLSIGDSTTAYPIAASILISSLSFTTT